MAEAVAPRADENPTLINLDQREFIKPILFKESFSGSSEPSMRLEDRDLMETTAYMGVRSTLCAPAA
jgi:hypothetical protein